MNDCRGTIFRPAGALSNPYRLSLFSTAAIVMICAAGPAYAQDSAPSAVAATQATQPAGTAQESPDGDGQEADIIVTGSSIRGVAPVGSKLVSAGQQEIEDIAATNITELTNTIPSITSAGSAPQGENAYSGFAPSIHGIGGSSSNSTLVLMDGLRMVGGSTQYMAPDPNTIPTPALERVEVITDGASSVYGSDAVSGVVNYITRRTYDGAQVNFRAGFGDHYSNMDASAILGTRWDTGGVYVAAQYTKQDPLLNIERPFTVRGDYRDVGGSNTNSFNCSPATITTPGGGSGVFTSPSATTTISNNVDLNGFCNNSIYGNGIPGTERVNTLVTSLFEFGDRLSLLTKFNYNVVTAKQDATPGQLGNITVFGTGPQANPFFIAPAGDPTATREGVTFVALRPDGEYGREEQESETFYATSVLEADLGSEWTGTASLAVGRTHNTRGAFDVFCGPCATLALNGTTQANGSTTASSAPNQNVIVTQLPLTTGNALDVWRGVEDNRTSEAVLDYIYSNNELLTHRNGLEQVKGVVQGPLVDLPAGALRVAAGAEYMWLRQRVTDLTPNNVGNTSLGGNFTDFTLRRQVYSGFAEAYIPVISSDMEVPGVDSFDLNLSIRYDHYNDFGGTTNPKVAANWRVVPGLQFRGNWAKSFVAPAMYQVGDPNRGFVRGSSGAGRSGQINVPVNTYPEVLLLPGCAGATVTCRIGSGTNPGLTRSLGAGLAGTDPQLGKSWSIGVDVGPQLVPNLNLSVTYWNTRFTGATSIPAVELLLYSGALNDRLKICPSGCTAAEIEEFTQVNNGAPFNAVLPPVTYFLIDRNLQNLLNFDVAGIDAQAEYRIRTAAAGEFSIGGQLTYFTKYNQWFFDAPRFSILNTSGYNSQFPSIQTRGRAHLRWELEGFTAALFMNFTGKYRNWISTSVEPRTLDANGNPNGGGDVVEAEKTFDLNLSYEGDSGILDGKRFFVNVKNLFDQDPVYYNGNTSGIGVGAWGYNGFVSNPLGRIISVGFSADF